MVVARMRGMRVITTIPTTTGAITTVLQRGKEGGREREREKGGREEEREREREKGGREGGRERKERGEEREREGGGGGGGRDVKCNFVFRVCAVCASTEKGCVCYCMSLCVHVSGGYESVFEVLQS